MRRKHCAAALIFFIAAASIAAENGVAFSTDLGLQISSRPEAKLSLTQSFIFPFMRFDGPLTRDNTIKAALTAEVSPLSVNGLAEITWTPIAFFQVVAGGKLGSGWNIPLGKGIGVNADAEPGKPEPHKRSIEGKAFGGLLSSVWGGGVIQFDLAAILPGDWNHLVFRTYQGINYRSFTGALSGESWIFENDDAENRNGLVYSANYLLGYQMPSSPILNMAGLMAEVEQYLYHTPGGDKWGDGLGRWIFSTLFNFTITEKFSAALILQMRTRRNYGHSDYENTNELFYQSMTIDKDDPYRLVFYRAAVILTLNLH
jgi:hypothetical protein